MPCDTKGSVCLHTFKFQLLNKHNTRLTGTQAPTTIFANAFELYIDNKGLQTQLKKPHADYAYDVVYRYVSKDLINKTSIASL